MDEQINNQPRVKEGKTWGSSCIAEEDRNKPTYCVTEVPAWYLCILLAIQHYLTAFGGIISIPLTLSEGLCLQHDSLTRSRLINTIFFVCGLCTLLQVTFGVRNIFVLGFSMFAALIIPNWIMKNPDFFKTGVTEVDRLLHMLLTTHMFVGGFLGFFLVITIPGTRHERGLLAWNKAHLEDSSSTLGIEEVYDLPFGITSCLSSQSWVR